MSDTRDLPTSDVIHAVEPTSGRTVHLYLHGYQPGAKARHPSTVTMCNVLVGGAHPRVPAREVVPLAEAVNARWWPASARSYWRVCHVCVGHALLASSLVGEAVGLVLDGAATRKRLRV